MLYITVYILVFMNMKTYLVTFKVTTFYKSSKSNTFFHVKKSVQKFRSFFLGKEPKTNLLGSLICTHRNTYRSVTF